MNEQQYLNLLIAERTAVESRLKGHEEGSFDYQQLSLKIDEINEDIADECNQLMGCHNK